jgi:hypothetical protein
VSQNQPTRIYDERPKHPVSGDCALVDGPSSEGDRTVDCSTYVRTDLIMHRVLTRQSPLRMRVEARVRAPSSRFFEDGYSRHVGSCKVALLIEGLVRRLVFSISPNELFA